MTAAAELSGDRSGGGAADERDAALLALGRWFMERAALDFRVATGPEELHAIHRQRRQHVSSAGWHAGDGSDDGEEKDGYDADAIHLGAWDGDVLAGSARVILPSTAGRLPTEEAFELRIEPASKVVECGRWVVAEAYRDRAHRVSMGISGLACLQVVLRGYRFWAGMTTPRVIALWQALGFRLETLTPPRLVLGAERVAVRCDLHASLPGLFAVLGPLGAPVPVGGGTG
jgi:N-acyl-L-homoserine lactone synthetase